MKKDEKAEEKIEQETAACSCEEAQENCCCKDDENTCGDAQNNCSTNDGCCCGEDEAAGNDLTSLKGKLELKSRECEEYFQKLQRTAAEFDNFKKRTIREKEILYTDAVSDAVKAFLPVIDSIDRAVQACSESTEAGAVKEGIELIYRQIRDVMKNMGIEEIRTTGEAFNPELHNAVMHIEDEAYDTNVIVEEFQKGYMYKDKVIRYSMVKVAN